MPTSALCPDPGMPTRLCFSLMPTNDFKLHIPMIALCPGPVMPTGLCCSPMPTSDFKLNIPTRALCFDPVFPTGRSADGSTHYLCCSQFILSGYGPIGHISRVLCLSPYQRDISSMFCEIIVRKQTNRPSLIVRRVEDQGPFKHSDDSNNIHLHKFFNSV